LEDIRSGRSKPIPSEEVERELDELIADSGTPDNRAR
jgi:hypothetical protein